MSSNDLPLLKGTQVSPLPVGSGGNNTTKKELNQLNLQVAMLDTQAVADQKFDPPVPKPVTKSHVTEGFCGELDVDLPAVLSVIGVGFILYGFFSK
jgi:hypothetical protein